MNEKIVECATGKESRGGRFFSGSMDDENVGERQSTALNVVQLSHRRHVCEKLK